MRTLAGSERGALALVWVMGLAQLAVVSLTEGSQFLLFAASMTGVGSAIALGAWRRRGLERVAWGWLAAGWWISALGMAMWAVPSLSSDVGLVAYNLYYPLIGAGLVLQVRRPPQGGVGLARLALDVGGVVFSTAVLLWLFALRGQQGPLDAKTWVTIVGETGVLAATAAVLHGTGRDRVDLGVHLLGLGLLVVTLADLVELGQQGAWSRGLLTVGSCVVATGGLLRPGLGWPASRAGDGVSTLQLLAQVPVLAASVVFGALLVSVVQGRSEVLPGLSLGVATLSLVTVVRLLLEQRELERELVERDHRESERLRAQRLEALGQLAGTVVHDLNNVLAVISACTEELALDGDSPTVNDLRTAGERGAALTRNLLRFVRDEAHPGFVAADAGEVVSGARPLLERVMRGHGRLEVDLRPSPLVRVDPAAVEIALLNLVVNARDALRETGTVRIEVLPQTIAAGDDRDLRAGTWVELAVVDDGPGMDAPTLAQATKPFFTTKSSGTGLGLPSVLATAAACGGKAVVASEPGRGTRVSLYLPPAAAASAERDLAR